MIYLRFLFNENIRTTAYTKPSNNVYFPDKCKLNRNLFLGPYQRILFTVTFLSGLPIVVLQLHLLLFFKITPFVKSVNIVLLYLKNRLYV